MRPNWRNCARAPKVHNLFADLEALACIAGMAGALHMATEAAICRGRVQPVSGCNMFC
jgi:hypothetical protein